MSNDNIDTAGSPGKRRGLTIGLAGGLLAGTAAGLVFGVPGLSSAASDPTTAAPAVVVQQTDETGPTAPADAGEMGTHLRESLQSLVDDGTITAEQADAVVAQLVASRPEPGEFGGGPGHFGGGRGGPGGGHGGLMGGAAGVASEAVTDLLGIDAQDLRTQLRDGSTLAEIATANGVDPQAVIDELAGEVQERLDNAVADGRIDQAEADEKAADVETRITDMVNNGRPERGADDTEQAD